MKYRELQKNNVRPVRGKTRSASATSNGGYIALISAVIISFILVMLTFSVSAKGYYSRFNVSNTEYKRISLGLAESCANSALLKVAQDYGYLPPVGGEAVTVGSETCLIKSVTYGPEDASGRKTASIVTQGTFHGAFSNVKVSASVENPSFSNLAHSTFIVYLHVVNNDGGMKAASDFSVTVAPAANPTPATFVGSETGTTVTVDGGSTVSVGVTAPSGYTQTLSGCSGTITAGGTKTCVITEDDVPNTATLTLIANIKNDNGGTKGPSDFPLYIDGTQVTPGIPVTLAPGAHKATSAVVTGYATSTWGYQCPAPGDGGITLAKGDNKTCVVIYDDIPPPAPACVDTVLMLSGAMTGQSALDAEAAAARSFLDYSSSTGLGSFIGIGSYGGLDGSAAQVPTGGQLTGTYGNSGAMSSTSAKFPTVNVSPNQWTSPANAFTNDTTFTTDATNGEKQGFGNFALNVPAGATINGVEVVADGKASAASLDSAPFVPNDVGNFDNQWKANPSNSNSGKRVNAVIANDTDSTYMDSSASGQAQTYIISPSGIPAGSTINSVTLTAVARGGLAGASIKLRVENGTGAGQQVDDAGHNLTTAYTSTSTIYSINPLSAAPWQLSDFNTARFGVVRTNTTSAIPRVTYLHVVVNYTPPGAGIGINLSWDNGTTWTPTTKAISFGATEASTTVGGSSDTWGRAWTGSDLSDGNFVLRVNNTSASGVTASLNYVTVKVYYSLPASGLYATVNAMRDLPIKKNGDDISAAIAVAKAELTSARHRPTCNKTLVLVSDGQGSTASKNAALDTADTAKVSGVEIYTIHFGNPPSGRDFVAQIASGTVPVSGHRPGSFDDTSNSQTQSIIDAENADGDHFFISPDASQFSAIFDAIGVVVFAGAGAPPAAPTRATLIVTTHIVNDNGGPALPSDFSMTISPSLSAVPVSPFVGVDTPGVTISVDPGSYTVSETSALGGYTEIDGFGCSGTIAAGDTISCTITNDDDPPPPPPLPPPPPEINIGSWEEPP